MLAVKAESIREAENLKKYRNGENNKMG